MPFGVPYLDTPARFELTLLSPEAFHGAAHGPGHPLCAAMDSLPRRRHVDRLALLLQLCAGSFLRRDGRDHAEQRHAEARAACAVVVSLGCHADLPVGPRDTGDAQGELDRCVGHHDPHRRGLRDPDVSERVVRHLAQSEGRDCVGGHRRGGRPSQPQGRRRGAPRLPRVANQHGHVLPYAVLHGCGVALHAQPRPQRGALGCRVAGHPGAAGAQRGGRPGDDVTVAAPARLGAPAVGDLAPDFTLASTAGADVTLSSFRGTQQVLLAFFPLAFTSTCTAEMCAFSEDFDQFARARTAVLPITVDSVPTLKEFKAKHAIKVDLLSDFKRQVSRAYGTLLEAKFHSNRSYFLIDREGRIRWQHTEAELKHRRDDAELLRQIEALAR